MNVWNIIEVVFQWNMFIVNLYCSSEVIAVLVTTSYSHMENMYKDQCL